MSKKKLYKKRIIELDMGTYFQVPSIIVIFAKPGKDYKDKVREYGHDLPGELSIESGGLAYSHSSGTSVILIDDTQDSGYVISVVAHELIHAVNNLFESIGIESSNKNDEAFAYQHTYLMKQVMDNINI